VVFVYLTAGEMVAPAALIAYQKTGRTGYLVCAFGSHVDVEYARAARSAGCQVVMPRSKFSAELPTLMRQYFQLWSASFMNRQPH